MSAGLQIMKQIPLAILALACVMGGIMYFSGLQDASVFLPKNTAIAPEDEKCLAKESAIVTKIVDGDTVIVEGGHRVRLVGIDADEKDFSCFEDAKSGLGEVLFFKQ